MCLTNFYFKENLMKYLFKKTVLLLVIFSMADFFYAEKLSPQEEYPVNFNYSMTVKSGQGNSGAGNIPLVKINSTSAKLADITLPPFVFSEKMTINSFTIKNVQVEEKNDRIYFKLDSFSTDDGKYKIKGYKVEGTIYKGQLELKVIYKAGKMPFKLTVDYYSVK